MSIHGAFPVFALLSGALGQVLAQGGHEVAPGLVRELFGNPRLETVYGSDTCSAPLVEGEERGNDWALRFLGQITAPRDGEYRFRLEADTGARLRIGEELVVDGWAREAARTGTAALGAGEPVAFILEYFFDRGQGGQLPTLRLYWTPPGQAEEPVPARAFGLPEAPVTVLGEEQGRVDMSLPDGGLAPAPGVVNTQVLRVTRDRPDLADGDGWTYAHHMDLAVWKGRLYAAWAMTPVDEDKPPYKVVYATSSDGFSWTAPADLFPREIAWPARFYFFRASNGRMLAFCAGKVTDESVREDAKNALLVREIGLDHTLGEVFTLVGQQPGLPPSYGTSEDAAFVAACEEAVAHPLLLEQQDYGVFLGERRMRWHTDPPLYGGHYPFGKALCFYHRADGAVVGLSKMGFATVSTDGGREWSEPTLPPTLMAGSAKVWGQRTADGRYALVYNPDPTRSRRYPLVVVRGDDGRAFRGMRVVHGECPPKRYVGLYKDRGYQYVRGLAEWSDDGTFADRDALWLIYSVHKEDIWVARVPLADEAQRVDWGTDDFDALPPGRPAPGWNLYCPRWAPVRVVEEPGRAGNRCLELRDGDPFDYARAVRLFPESAALAASLRVRVVEGGCPLEVELLDGAGRRPVRVCLTEAGRVVVADGDQTRDVGACPTDEWLEVSIRADVGEGAYRVVLDGAEAGAFRFAEPSGPLERLSLRTGPWRGLSEDAPVSPGEDVPRDRPAVFLVDDVAVRPE